MPSAKKLTASTILICSLIASLILIRNQQDIRRHASTPNKPLSTDTQLNTPPFLNQDIEIVPGEFIVKLKNQAHPANQKTNSLQNTTRTIDPSLQIVETLPDNIYLIRSSYIPIYDLTRQPPNIKNIALKNSNKIFKKIKRHPSIDQVTPNYIIKLIHPPHPTSPLIISAPPGQETLFSNILDQNPPSTQYLPVQGISTIPNDEFFFMQYALDNDGEKKELVIGGEVVFTIDGEPGADIDAPEAWNITTGDPSIVIAVVDTGIDYTHLDLANNIWINEPEQNGNPGVDDDGNGYTDDIYGYDFHNNDPDPMDDHYHGTHVSGSITAIGNNTSSIAGVSWNSKVMAVKTFSDRGSGTAANIIKGLNYIRTQKANGTNVKIINASWGIPYDLFPLFEQLFKAQTEGILFVASAGNSGLDNDYYHQYPASFHLDNIISTAASDYNDQLAPFSNRGQQTVDIAAPGVDILSLYLDGKRTFASGTSMASPHVVGTAALLWAQNPDLTYLEVRKAILFGADYKDSLIGNTFTSGRLNANNALKPPPPIQHYPKGINLRLNKNEVERSAPLMLKNNNPTSIPVSFNLLNPDIYNATSILRNDTPIDKNNFALNQGETNLSIVFNKSHYPSPIDDSQIQTLTDSLTITYPEGHLLIPVKITLTISNFQKVRDGDTFIDQQSTVSVSFVDIDNDSYLDIFALNNIGDQNSFYKNSKIGTFDKLESNLDDQGSAMGKWNHTWGDFNNDGFIDLFFADVWPNESRLYKNNGDGTFIQLSNKGIDINQPFTGASWGDYNNDSYLDLAVVASGQAQLYQNNSDETFSLTNSIPTNSHYYGIHWGDFNNDGHPDLLATSNVASHEHIYINNGDGTFEEKTLPLIGTTSNYGASLGDYNNDGYLDIFLTNIKSNLLYRNEGDLRFNQVDIPPMGGSGRCFSSSWGDFDNDGNLDLFCTDGRRFPSGYSQNTLYHNQGNGIFITYDDGITEQEHSISNGVAAGDYDRDGDLDLYIGNWVRQKNILYQNIGNDNNWINIKLIGAGTPYSNKSAIGTKVSVKSPQGTQFHEVSSQTGALAQNSLEVEFGLGQDPVIDQLSVLWPSGIEYQKTNINVNQFITIFEGVPGDCNTDGSINTTDIESVVTEIYDGDGSNPRDTPGGSFPGNPIGCDANQDNAITAGDTSCIALIIELGQGACQPTPSPTPEPPPGDLNNDNQVDGSDIKLLLPFYNQTDNDQADIDDNDKVNLLDYVIQVIQILKKAMSTQQTTNHLS
jgi:subtilisin family serine protease